MAEYGASGVALMLVTLVLVMLVLVADQLLRLDQVAV
jgi:hypothetical protein